MFKFKTDKEEIKLRAYALKNGAFESKKSAFDYFFVYEGKSVEEAEKLAATVAASRGVPDIPIAPNNTMDKVKIWIKQGTDIYNEYPKLGEFVVGLISGAATSLLGVAAGNKLAEKKTDEPVHELNNVEPIEINDNAEPIQHQD